MRGTIFGGQEERGGIEILRRLLRYAEKVYQYSDILGKVTDSRRRPRHSTKAVVQRVAVMMLTRLGSLHALEQTKGLSFWRDSNPPSADTMARVFCIIDLASLRGGLHHFYDRLARNKALPPSLAGLRLLVLDGHESHATYRRHCEGCLSRTIHTEKGDRIQYYHRHVTALLWGKTFCLLLDAEPQQPGEDEIATAIRLLERVVKSYPRAFDVVGGDALYADPRLFQWAKAAGKDVIAVLKNETWDLYKDARALFDTCPSQQLKEGILAWDLSEFTSWSSPGFPVRVVRSRETRTVRRQLDGQKEELLSEWMWVTTLDSARASTATVVTFGHARWGIENQGFNETVSYWHADHVYTHHPSAILAFTLMTYLAYNLFHAFFARDLKPAMRRRFTMKLVSQFILSDLLQTLPLRFLQPP